MIIKKFFKHRYENYADKYYGTWIYWNSSVVAINLKENFEKLFAKYIKYTDEVLDLGAGRLPFRDIIKKYSPNYYSLDFKKTHKDLDYIGTVSDTKLEEGRFNVIFCNQVLEHVPNPEQSFCEIYRILKPNGIVIISTPFFIELHNEPYDYFRYTKYALKMLANKGQFKVLELYEIGGIFALLSRFLSKFFIFAFYWIPIFNYFAIACNLLLQRVLYMFDKIFGLKKIFPNEYILVLKK